MELIYYYTSEMMIRSKLDGYPDAKIYQLINRYMEKETLTFKSLEQIKQCWVYHYIHSMLQHLSSIKPQQRQLFRGGNLDIYKEVGEEVSFKAWTSSSES